MLDLVALRLQADLQECLLEVGDRTGDLALVVVLLLLLESVVLFRVRAAGDGLRALMRVWNRRKYAV